MGEDIEDLSGLQIILQGHPLFLGEAGVLDISVANHLAAATGFTEALSCLDGPSSVLARVYRLFA